MMKERHSTTTRFTLIISTLLIVLFATPAPAIKKWRESKLKGGWQIWIQAAGFDRRGGRGGKFQQAGQEVPELAKKVPEAVLGEDVLIASKEGGFTEFDFEAPNGSDAYLYVRSMDLRQDGGQSWRVRLNNDQEGVVTGTEDAWTWKPEGAAGLAKTKLKKGMNTVRIIPREAAEGRETLMDIFVVSTKAITPTDEDYMKAPDFPLAVEPAGKLATTWAALKHNF